jgi:hypothetical protein
MNSSQRLQSKTKSTAKGVPQVGLTDQISNGIFHAGCKFFAGAGNSISKAI